MKVRFFKHLRHGGDEDSERVYRWHIEKRSGARMQAGLATDRWKRGLDDYVIAARDLLASVQHSGVLDPVPVDPNGDLLDGSHRVACTLALGLAYIAVKNETRFAWAPPWGREWFVQNGMAADDLERLEKDMAEIAA